MVPTTVPHPRHPPWLLTGSLGLVTLLSIATSKMLRLPLPVSRAFALRSAFDTPVHPFVLDDDRQRACPSSRTLVIRCGPIPALFRGDRRLSQLPWRPQYRSALLSDPGRTSTPDHCGVSAWPPLRETRRLHHCKLSEAQSHGFTARCLRLKAPFLDASQGSLPVDGQSFPGGVVPAGSLQRLSVVQFRLVPPCWLNVTYS